MTAAAASADLAALRRNLRDVSIILDVACPIEPPGGSAIELTVCANWVTLIRYRDLPDGSRERLASGGGETIEDAVEMLVYSAKAYDKRRGKARRPELRLVARETP